MPERSRSFLFGLSRVAAVGGGSGAFAHTFGGPSDRVGASPAECGGRRIHLLFRLDLSDPAVPIALPGVRFLPLYYCFDFRVNELGYRLTTDGAMTTYFPENEPNVSGHEQWPADDYPAEFPRSPARVEPVRYDPADPADAAAFAGVFGVGGLSPENRADFGARAAEFAELFGFDPPGTDDELAELLPAPFAQSRPSGRCPNPDCDAHRSGERLRSIALVSGEPVPGVRPWGDHGAGVQVVFESCPHCHAVLATNQAT